MGVYLDKYVGYMVNITDDFFNLKQKDEVQWENFKDIYLYGEEEIPEELRKIGLVCKYSNDLTVKDNIEVVYDGMNGEYCYLVYIDSVDRYSSDETAVNETVNEALKQVSIPTEVTEKLNKVYETLFEKKMEKPIYLQMLHHWH